MSKFDDLYPSIGFEITAKMAQDDEGRWYFEVQNHILGPDDIITRKSQPYSSKKTCLMNFISSMPEFVRQTMADI